ncbi:MAG: hypothetical protein WC773_04645 [Patescibacteria group bacterium]|jgi:hypothetical protein
MKIDCNPNPLSFDGQFTHFINSLDQVNKVVLVSKFEVKPTTTPGEIDFKITLLDGRKWFQVMKKIDGKWAMKTTQMDYMTVLEVAPFRDVRVYLNNLVDAGLIDIKIDY